MNRLKGAVKFALHPLLFTSVRGKVSSRYGRARKPSVAGLRRLRVRGKFGQVATTCEEPSGQFYGRAEETLGQVVSGHARTSGHVYVVRGNLVKSLRRARKTSGQVYDVRGNLVQVATTWRNRRAGLLRRVSNLVKSLRRAEEPSGKCLRS
ncbi:hypothetical protein Tco_0294742 [Tanacetum coccineum]